MVVMVCELNVKRSPGRQRSGPRCSRGKKEEPCGVKSGMSSKLQRRIQAGGMLQQSGSRVRKTGKARAMSPAVLKKGLACSHLFSNHCADMGWDPRYERKDSTIGMWPGPG